MAEIATREQLQDPDYAPPLGQATVLGIQHVLAMFAGNVTVPIIIAGAAGLVVGDKIFLIQMAMVFAGLATAEHPITALADALDGEVPPDEQRCRILQAALLISIS